MKVISTSDVDVHITDANECIFVSEGGTEKVEIEDLAPLARLWISDFCIPFTQPTIYSLSAEESFVYMWQYHLLSGFWERLADAMCRADDSNLTRLEIGFPDQVAGMRKFRHVSGWWSRVCIKARNQEKE